MSCEGWKIQTLESICDLIPGFAFKSSHFGDYKSKVIKIADIQPPYVNDKDLTGVDIEPYKSKNLKKYIANKGDFVLAMTGATIGKVGKVLADKLFINQRILLFKPKKEYIDSRFLYYYIQKGDFQRYILNHIDSETAQPNISGNSVGKYPICFPFLEKQKRISDILSSFDDKIELNNKININLEQQAQAIFRSWFVDFEPFQDGEFVDSELGMIPKGWKEIEFRDFLTQSTEKTNLVDIPEYSVTNDGIIPRNEKYKKLLSRTTFNNKIIRNGNLVFGMSREILNWGIMKDAVGGVSSAYNVFIIIEEKINPIYLELYMYAKIQYFNNVIKPAAREGQGIDKGVLLSKKIYLPPQNVLYNFLKVRSSIFDAKTNYEKQNITLSQLRDTLLPKLMSGEIEV